MFSAQKSYIEPNHFSAGTHKCVFGINSSTTIKVFLLPSNPPFTSCRWGLHAATYPLSTLPDYPPAAFRSCLRMANLVDANDAWVGGETVLVQVCTKFLFLFIL